MLSTTIKRSVATVGVVAGLLAAAVPASAVTLNGSGGGDSSTLDNAELLDAVKGPKPSDADRTLITNGSADDNMYHLPDVNDEVLAVKAPASAQGGPQDPAFRFEMAGLPVKAPTNAGTQVGSEGVKDDVPLETVSFTFKGEVIGLEPNALGTQVGSEGVKAPTRADDQMYNPKEIGID